MMFDVCGYLSSFSKSEQREIIYFLFRYFKQSPHIEKEGKDIFDDVFFDDQYERSPSRDIRAATISVIRDIERSLAKTAFDLSVEEANAVLDTLIEIEADLESPPSDDHAKKAAAFFEGLS